jgi:hypothetical protein
MRAAISAAAIKAVVGNPASGVYWLKSQYIDNGRPFQIYCDFTVDGGIGYAIYYNNYFDESDGGSSGYAAGPSRASMQSTAITGTPGYSNEYNIYPYLMPGGYNNGAGATRMMMYVRTNTGVSSRGICGSSNWKWLRIDQLSPLSMRDIWATVMTNNSYQGTFLMNGSNGVRAYAANSIQIEGSHGNSGGVSQWNIGNNSNSSVVFEYKPDTSAVSGGYTDPNHYWMIDNGDGAAATYFRANTEYGAGGQAFIVRWGGIGLY